MRRMLLLTGFVAAAALLSACRRGSDGGASPPGSPPGSGTVTDMAAVEQIDVVLLESHPPSVQITASGHLLDSCSKLLPPVTSQTDDGFSVTLNVQRPAGQECAEALIPFNQSITIDVSALGPGAYMVDVNGIARMFVIPSGSDAPQPTVPPRPTPATRGGSSGGGSGMVYINLAVFESGVITIAGGLADACTSLGQITEEVVGNEVRITVTANRPSDAMCAQVIKDFETTYTLQAALAPGTYRLIVNEKDFGEFTVE